MPLSRLSPCKVNLLLNILGRRADGFHELETVLQPVPLCDRLEFTRTGSGLRLTCDHPHLPLDAGNLVHRAATAFLAAARLSAGVSIHLEKRIPLEAGLGGGSSNAATTLLGLNELFGQPLTATQLESLAARLGSDVPFFLQRQPALATGRGETVTSLDFFPALRGAHALLIHPGFGVATAWAYRELPRFPTAFQGQPGRARRLIDALRTGDLRAAAKEFYNALEAPVLHKYPILAMFQEFLRQRGAPAVLMSGSGSTTFALTQSGPAASRLEEEFKTKFGATSWTAVVPLETPEAFAAG